MASSNVYYRCSRIDTLRKVFKTSNLNTIHYHPKDLSEPDRLGRASEPVEIAILWPASSTVGRAIYSGPGPRNDRSTLGVADSPRRGSFSQNSSKMRFSHVNVPYIEVGQRRASGGEQISIIGSIPGPEDLVNIQETFQIFGQGGSRRIIGLVGEMVYPSKNIRIWYHNLCWHRSRTLPDSLEVGGNEEKMEKPTHGLTIVCLYLICDLDNHICGWGTRCHVGLCQPPLKISFLLINEHWTPKLAKQYPLSIVFQHLGEGENLLIHYCSWGDSKVA